MDTIDLLPDTVNLNKIEEGLFLGNLTAALHIPTLQEYHISHVLTVDSEPLQQEILDIPGLSFMYIGVDDMAHSDLLSHFDKSSQFISDGQIKGNVLVHCYFGISRSATLVIAHLMKKHSITFIEALQRVKKNRHCIGPNEGFMKQLLFYENLNNRIDLDNYSMKIYRMERAAFDFKHGRFLKENFADILQPMSCPDFSSQINANITVKCRECRQILVAHDQFLPHFASKLLSFEDKEMSREIDASSVCTEALFTLPLSWIKDVFQKPQGKVLCFKCGQKLGSYNWINGCSCPCGAISNPGFCINSSKVDLIKQKFI